MKEQFLRFGISDYKGFRAATWKLWTPQSKSDIYLSCRELGGAIKTSLHESGRWHIGYTDGVQGKYFESDVSFRKNKYIERWPRPRPIANGVTLAFRIVTPFSSVKTPIEKDGNNIFWVPNCPEFYATEIDIIITSFDEGQDNWPGKKSMGTKLIGRYKICNQETVWVIYWIIPMPDFSTIKGSPLHFFKGLDKSNLKSENLKAILLRDESDGSRTLCDCAVNSKFI